MDSSNGRVKIYLDNETGLNYIIGRRIVLFENGVTVDLAAFNNRGKKTITELIREAMVDPENCNWDFIKSCQTADLTKRKGTKRVVSQVQPAKAVPEPEPEAPKQAEKAPIDVAKVVATRISRMREFFSAPHADIIIIATVIGIACAFMSMYHAYTFLHDVNGKPVPIAFITAFTMVLFASSAFTIARHLGSDRKIGFLSRLVLSPTFVALGIGVVWFLVFSTVTVNYEQFTARDTAKEEQFVAKDTSVSKAAQAMSTKETEIKNAEADVARLTKQSDDWYAEYMRPIPSERSSEDPVEQKKIDARQALAMNKRNVAYKNYTDAQKLLLSATTRRDTLLREKGALVESSGNAEEKAKSSRETAYTVFASKTGITESTLQFLVYVIPPTFFDVVSPVTLSVVLLLRDRRRDKSEAKEGLLSKFKKWLARAEKNKEAAHV